MAERKKRIEQQFSTWDGSHRNVVEAIKRSMKDPNSYQNTETRYRDNGSSLTVRTTFRGTNSFGGVVPNTVIAEVDDDGNVISINTIQ